MSSQEPPKKESKQAENIKAGSSFIMGKTMH